MEEHEYIEEDITYSEWMVRWEEQTMGDSRFNGVIDIDYNVVDDMFHQGFSPEDALKEYWERA